MWFTTLDLNNYLCMYVICLTSCLFLYTFSLVFLGGAAEHFSIGMHIIRSCINE